jgi:hypothetical protein
VTNNVRSTIAVSFTPQIVPVGGLHFEAERLCEADRLEPTVELTRSRTLFVSV